VANYFSASGFNIEIQRPSESEFSGDIFVNGTFEGSFSSTDVSLQLTADGTWTFEFYNVVVGDPIAFILFDYDTGNFIASLTSAELTFDLALTVGFDGESDKSLIIRYPLADFIVPNPDAQLRRWVCSLVAIGCEGPEETINSLPSPKIIGNLTSCAEDEFVGDDQLAAVCSSNVVGEFYRFAINDVEGNLIYSRIECCCPEVIPDAPILVDFVCTCPDWGKATSYNQTLFSPSVRLRQWVNSGAGAIADCKHIMAAKRIMGIDQPVFSDPPVSGGVGRPMPM
jgi:hypothetical protein